MDESIRVRLDAIDEKLEAITKQLRHDFVLRVEFRPVQKLVYGAVVMILMSVLGAILVAVVRAAT